jgi:acetolactate synthase-1/2/3 large subunit
MTHNKTNQKIRGAEAVICSLLEEGVEVIFGYPGGAIMPIYDALYDYQEQIRHILVRHEQGATHAAEGYARIKGKAGVVFATSGPGATNLITGIADAMIDSIPLVCITGQVPRAVLGTDAFQETDVIGISIPVTKWNYQVTNAAEIPYVMAKAFYIATSGRPGPVLVDITKDAQFAEMEFSYQKITSLPSIKVPNKPNISDLKEAAELINNAKRPYILAGHGIEISGAFEELRALAEKADIPVACTLHGLSVFPMAHKLYAGMLGMHGNYGPNVLCNDADVVIAVGMRFDDRVTGDLKTYLKKSSVIHIEIDPAEINKIVKAEVAIMADAKETLSALLPLVNQNKHPEWLSKFESCNQREHEEIIAKGINSTREKIGMIEVVNMLSEITKGESIIVADVGQHQMMAARYYRFQKANSWITSGGLGTMGFALPAAFGAKVATETSGNRDVIAIIGDGSFQMTLQEMATIAQDNIKLKIIILNNNFLGMVRQWQELFFDNRYSFVDLKNPNFVKLSEAFGITANKVMQRADLKTALQTMLDFDGPYLLEVEVEKEENVFPMVPSGASISDIRLS